MSLVEKEVYVKSSQCLWSFEFWSFGCWEGSCFVKFVNLPYLSKAKGRRDGTMSETRALQVMQCQLRVIQLSGQISET